MQKEKQDIRTGDESKGSAILGHVGTCNDHVDPTENNRNEKKLAGTHPNISPSFGGFADVSSSSVAPKVQAPSSVVDLSAVAALLAALGVPGGNTMLQGNSMVPQRTATSGVDNEPPAGVETGGNQVLQGYPGVSTAAVAAAMAAGGVNNELPAGVETGGNQVLQGYPGVSTAAVAAAAASLRNTSAYGVNNFRNPVTQSSGLTVFQENYPENKVGLGSRNLESVRPPLSKSHLAT